MQCIGYGLDDRRTMFRSSSSQKYPDPLGSSLIFLFIGYRCLFNQGCGGQCMQLTITAIYVKVTNAWNYVYTSAASYAFMTCLGTASPSCWRISLLTCLNMHHGVLMKTYRPTVHVCYTRVWRMSNNLTHFSQLIQSK
jgi:hypothetical protein